MITEKRKNNMWESPIELQFGINDMVSEFIKGQTEQTEKYIVESVQSVGIKIDKYELIKALNYDRNQYEKGYEDGYSVGYCDACEGNWVYNKNPDENGRYLVAVRCGNDKGIMIGKYIDGRWLFENKKVIAWQPLPEVPEVR